MAKLKQYRKMLTVAFLLGGCFVALGYRLVELQVFRHVALRSESTIQTRLNSNREARRGDIREGAESAIYSGMHLSPSVE